MDLNSWQGLGAVPHPADVGGHPGLGTQPLHQALQQRGQVDVIDGSLGQHLADPAHGPGCRVPDHHAGILHQLYQRWHGLGKKKPGEGKKKILRLSQYCILFTTYFILY